MQFLAFTPIKQISSSFLNGPTLVFSTGQGMCLRWRYLLRNLCGAQFTYDRIAADNALQVAGRTASERCARTFPGQMRRF